MIGSFFDWLATLRPRHRREPVHDPKALKSGSIGLGYESYPAARHVEGKAAIAIREGISSGGISFHNHPNGTCPVCDRSIPTLLPEGAKLWVVPPKDAVALTERWIAEPKLYIGNSAQPKARKAEE
jgi:SCP1.201-like deaminase